MNYYQAQAVTITGEKALIVEVEAHTAIEAMKKARIRIARYNAVCKYEAYKLQTEHMPVMFDQLLGVIEEGESTFKAFQQI